MNTEEHINKERQRRRRLIEEVAPLVDARLKSTAQSMPDRIVGEWRGKSIVDTAPLRPGAGKPVTAAELARYTVVFANAISNEVFAFCHRHQTAYSTYSQGDARCNAPKTWCLGCSSDPSWPPGIADPTVVAAENQAREQRIDKIKASRKTRIVKVTEIALERGTVTSQQAAQLLGIWDEIQAGKS
ncbi:Uncharacterised protein [Mycobacteroides abscessus subsp. massiliense]|uniref:hypothetical protein n=1 Tax=Mycobacteroides abscessus TaxID=36809 RepID=UPI0009A87977|nr:hypothetical protein [Mycobacteroides abscessus]SKT78121.1 Uncharacterised protein [Mycobacteroides abscessus subsp. massiliense]